MPFPTRENATYHKWLCATEQLQQIIKVKPFFRLSLFKSFSKLCAVKAYAVISLSALLCTQASAQKNNFSIDRRNNPLKDFSVTINKESHPFFVDIDGDGDYDCFSGEYTNGKLPKIYYYHNEGTNKNPFFKQVPGADNPLNKVAANTLTLPYFIDIDADGDYDCFIGEGSTGAILYYKNVGTATEPVFQKQSAANNPLSMVKFLASGIANPAFADLDGDGDYDCLVVDEDGNENFFKNKPKAEFTFTPLRWVDINKDGAVDVFQGNSNGSFVYQTLSSSSNAIVASPISKVQVLPNPSKEEFIVNLRTANAATIVRVTDEQGKIITTQFVSGNSLKFGKEFKPSVYFMQVMQNNNVV